jgi:hypothetical protein
MGIQARSHRNSGVPSNALFVFFLFFAGITAGIWVSMRYFNDPIAEQEIPHRRMPGRLERIIDVPKWLDHPYTRTENPYLADFQYHAPNFDLNRLFFGTAHASVPAPSALAEDFRLRQARGLMNANEERRFQERFEAESLATLERFGRTQSTRAFAEIRGGLADEKKQVGDDTMRVLRVPGMMLYLAASAATGRPVRARVGTGTVIRTHAISKDDYRLRIDHMIAPIGLALGSGYDSAARRRSISLMQSLGACWGVGVDRTVSSVENRRESAMRVQFSAPF